MDPRRRRTIKLEGSARLLVWLEEECQSPWDDLLGGWFIQLATTRDGQPLELTEPLLLSPDGMHSLQGHEFHLDELFCVFVGPLRLWNEGDDFFVEFRGKKARGKRKDLHDRIVDTFMA